MTALLALVAAELRQRRMLLAASGLLGLLALAAPLLPSLPPGQPAEVRAATALLVLAFWAPLLALLVGGTALAGEIADRRLGFYLARPLSTWKIWAGKMGAAVLLPLLAGLLVVLPAALAGGGFVGLFEGVTAREVGAVAGLATAALVVLVALANAAAIALRSRRPWLLLDLLALAFAAVLAAAAVRILLFAFVPDAIKVGSIALGLVVLLALLAAGAAAVHRGRGDLGVAHRALSLALWPGVLAGALGFVLFARWIVSAPIESLSRPGATAAPGATPWVTVTGEADHRFGYRPVFLLDTASGRAVRLGDGWSWPVFAADGSRAVWLRVGEDGLELWRLDLARSNAQPERTRVAFRKFPQRLEISPRGELVAARQEGRLLVHALADGRLLASTRLGRTWHAALFYFPDERRLRILALGRYEGSGVWDLALPGGKPVRQGAVAGSDWLYLWRPSPARDRALFRVRPGLSTDTATPLRLVELPSGELMSDLRDRPVRDGAVLADGRIALVETARGGQLLHLHSRDGSFERTFRFPGAARLDLGGQPAPGSLVVAAIARSRNETAYLLDLRSGGMRRIGEGLAPAGGTQTVGPGARLFLTEDGLVEIGENGARRRILPRPR